MRADSDAVIRVQAGSFTREQVPAQLVALVARSKSLHAYTAHKLYSTLTASKSTEVGASRRGLPCDG